MLIHLSPWQTTRTSIPTSSATTPSRRRKRSNSNGTKENDDGDGDDHHDDGSTNSHSILPVQELPVAVSYVLPTSKKRLARRKAQSNSKSTSEVDIEQRSVPVLSLTSAHKVTIIGRSEVPKNVEDDDEDDNKGSSSSDKKRSPFHYKEFVTRLQYQSRPGAAGSFFPTSSTAASKSKSKSPPPFLPCVAAIVDPQQDRVYAFQHNNTRLSSWKAWDGTGPDDEQGKTLKVELSSPALSLRILPTIAQSRHHYAQHSSSIVYGSCQDGSVFVARIITTMRDGSNGQSDDRLVVDYLPKVSSSPSHALPDGFEHLDTIAETDTSSIDSKKTGQKRKMSDSNDDPLSVIFYQVYGKKDDMNLTFVRHEVLVDPVSLRRGGVHSSSSNDSVIKHDTLIQKIGVLQLPSPKATRAATYIEKRVANTCFHLSKAQLIVSAVESNPTVAIVYNTVNENPDDPKVSIVRTFGALVSLPDCSLSSAPVELPSDSFQFGLVMGKLLVSATHESMSFYDIPTGSLVQSKSMKPLDLSPTKRNWVMTTDTMNNTLAFVVANQDGLEIRCTELSKGDDFNEKVTSSGMLKSSSILSSSVFELSRRKRGTKLDDFPSLVAFQQDNDGGESDRTESSLSALKSLDEIRTKLSDCGKGRTNNRTSFLEIFEGLISELSTSHELKKSLIMANGSGKANGNSYASHSKKGKNGIKVSPKTVILPNAKFTNNVGGSDHSSKLSHPHRIPSDVPQSFIDGTTKIVLSMIQYSGNNESSLSRETKIVLKTLLYSGKVSARLHFEGSYGLFESSDPHPLSLILRALERKDPDRSDYDDLSPVSLIVLMLQKCPDVTERQLVIMVDYIITRASEENISSALSVLQKKPETHRDLTPTNGKETTKLLNGDDTMDVENSKSNSNQSILNGVRRVLEMIVSYAECNESMLRAALTEGLSSGDEAIILARLLSDLLLTSFGKSSSPKGVSLQRHQVIRSICQWTATLCDVFRDDLISSRLPSTGETYLKFLIQSTKEVVQSSNALIACNDYFCMAESKSRRRKKKKKRNSAAACASSSSSPYYDDDNDEDDDDIPGYSIDRLVFYF